MYSNFLSIRSESVKIGYISYLLMKKCKMVNNFSVIILQVFSGVYHEKDMEQD